MDLETLHTSTEVIDALGGNVAVGKLTLSEPNAVSNWRGFGTFPPNTFLVLNEALRAIGKTAPPTLWKMKMPAEAAAS